ncbi:hypothetical protein ACXJJ3_00310 [Kribbella sp. WER1]
MSTDIERLLAAAADDPDQPPTTDIDNLLVQARRSVRRTRIATASTAVLTAGVIIAGITTWSANRTEGDGPAGTPTPGMTLTLDVRTGRIIDDETGKLVVPAPPKSTLSDADLLARCQPYDRSFLQAADRTKPWSRGGPLDARWKVVVKSGGAAPNTVMFLAPDKSVVSECLIGANGKPTGVMRSATTGVLPNSPHNLPQAEENGLRITTPGVTRVLVYMTDGIPHEALVGTDGFFTYDHTTDMPRQQILARIKGYDAQGRRIYDQVNQPKSQGR